MTTSPTRRLCSSAVLCALVGGMLGLGACRSSSPEGADDATSTGSDSGSVDTSSEGGEDGASCVPENTDDCMDPELKCMPWAEAMGPPEGHKCCPLDASPVSPGERCRVQDYVHSCIDDCPAGTMCMIDDVDALAGYCQAFCDIEDPGACGSEGVCMSLFTMDGATTPLCLSSCDPLAQDCESQGRPTWTCVADGPVDPEFVCLPPTLPEPALAYEACKIPSDCEAGLTCLPSSQILGCEHDRCCTPFCDTSEVPDVCTMGNECAGLDADVPGSETVGVCVDPSG